MKKLSCLLFTMLCQVYYSYGMTRVDSSTALLLSMQQQQQQRAYYCMEKKKSPINTPQKKDLDTTLDKQAQTYCNSTLPSLMLSQIRKNYFSLPQECRKNAIKNMSDAALISHCIALLLPKEIQDKILSYFVANNSELFTIFRTKPFLQTWQSYSMAKNTIKDPAIPIEPLCAMNLSDVELIIRLMQHDKNNPLIVNSEEHKKIKNYDAKIKDLYLKESSAIALRDKTAGCCFALPTIGLMLGEGISAITFLVTSTFGYPVCNPSFVTPVIIVPGITCMCIGCAAVAATKVCCPNCIPTEKIFVLQAK